MLTQHSKQILQAVCTTVLNDAIEEITELVSKYLCPPLPINLSNDLGPFSDPSGFTVNGLVDVPVETIASDSIGKPSSTWKRVLHKTLANFGSVKKVVKKKRVLCENNDFGLSHKLEVTLCAEGEENTSKFDGLDLSDSASSDAISCSEEG